MAKAIVPHFHNDQGVRHIDIGVTEFMCVGATPPYDHPHIYLDMGDDQEIVCPYCSTLYRLDHDLTPTQTIPAGCLLDMDDTEMGIDAKTSPIRENILPSA